MTSTAPSQYSRTPAKVIQFPSPNRAAYRTWSDENLETEYRLAVDLLATLMVEGHDLDSDSVEILSLKRNELKAEVDRRKKLAKHFKNSLNGPKWTPGSPSRRTDLIEFAQDLKALWPIDRFLTELMMVELRPTSRNRWQCRCFTGVHADRAPSMTVYGNDGRVFCHACRYHGDIFDITRLHFGLNSFAEAVRKIADASGSGAA